MAEESAVVATQFPVKELAYDDIFHALPMADKLAVFEQRTKNDPEFKKLFPDKASQLAAFEHILRLQIQRTSITKPTEENSEEFASEDSEELASEEPQLPESLPVQSTPEEPGTLSKLATAAGKGITRGLDTLPGMIAKPIGVATEQYGKIPEYLGLVSPETDNIFKRAGRGLQSPVVNKPLETTIAGTKGFEPSPPGYHALEHVISAAVGAAIPSAVTARLFPLLASGTPLPTIDQVKKGMALAAQGAGLAEVTRVVGGGETAQFITELVGGLLSPQDTYKVFQAVIKRPALQKYLMRTHEKQVTDIATEAFAGPKLDETLSGGTTTRTNQDLSLDDFLEQQKAPVRRAESVRTKAEADLQTIQAQGRALNSSAVQRIRTAEDLARDQARIAQQKLYDIEDQITQVRTQAGADARAKEAALVQRRLDLQEEYRQSVRASQDVERGVQNEVRTANKQAQQQVVDLQDHLDRIAAANQKDVNDALAFGKRSVESVAPEMAKAGVQRDTVGRKAVRVQGETEIAFYDRAAERLKTNSALGYGALEREHGIQVPATELYKVVQKYKPSLDASSIPTTQVGQSFAPKSAIADFEEHLAQLKEKQPGVKNLDNVVIGLTDYQNFRSRLLDDLRHTPRESQRYQPLRQLIAEVDVVGDNIGKKFPEAMAAYRELSSAYRREKIRLTGDPGYETQVKNPFTGERLRTPDEISRLTFGAGPGVSKGTTAGAQRERVFATYLRDLDDVLQDAYLQGDTTTQAAAIRAKHALFDSVRVQFYDAAIDITTGNYLPKEAAKWIRENSALLNQNPELKKIFLTQRDRANAIREVQAAAQGAQELPNAYIQAMKESLRETQAAGGERVFEARNVARGERRTAEDLRAAAQRDIATESADLAETKASVQTQTSSDRTQAARERKAELARIEQQKEATTRSLEDEKATQVERQRLATEDLKFAKEQEDKAIAYYKDTFGARDAAERALAESTAERVLGATPADIIAHMESLSGPDKGNARAYYFSKFFERAKGNKAVEEALLQARWRHFLGGETVADPIKAAQFIKENRPWLERFYPDYLLNIERVERAFNRINEVHAQRPTNIKERSLFSHAGTPGITTAALFTLGHMSFRDAAFGGLGVAGLLELNYRRKIATIPQIYMHPSDAAIIAKALGPTVTPEQARQAAFSVLSRSGILGKEQVNTAQE